jgi:hypothetical protein
MAAKRQPPWKKANPKAKRGDSRKLSPVQKAAARKRATKAGRPYPNLVDNMRASSSER